MFKLLLIPLLFSCQKELAKSKDAPTAIVSFYTLDHELLGRDIYINGVFATNVEYTDIPPVCEDTRYEEFYLPSGKSYKIGCYCNVLDSADFQVKQVMINPNENMDCRRIEITQ